MSASAPVLGPPAAFREEDDTSAISTPRTASLDCHGFCITPDPSLIARSANKVLDHLHKPAVYTVLRDLFWDSKFKLSTKPDSLTTEMVLLTKKLANQDLDQAARDEKLRKRWALTNNVELFIDADFKEVFEVIKDVPSIWGNAGPRRAYLKMLYGDSTEPASCSRVSVVISLGETGAYEFGVKEEQREGESDSESLGSWPPAAKQKKTRRLILLAPKPAAVPLLVARGSTPASEMSIGTEESELSEAMSCISVVRDPQTRPGQPASSPDVMDIADEASWSRERGGYQSLDPEDGRPSWWH
ncbi:uncharacterized protein E0L32_003826 [Thyridium curvatum]|uniref:Uncharacterized protein n=1 Tax=Thyridium curvatum TaxID=1093900 RepID=A0A507B2N5_9PEZI|nr:uncharacterized protein E0L32_003826 [Thyridium curvatum]TPX16532.1 hypothetical protein E0L32_003826 [Thyridium curvatum]